MSEFAERGEYESEIVRLTAEVDRLTAEVARLRGQAGSLSEQLSLKYSLLESRREAVRGLTFGDRLLLLVGYSAEDVIGRRAEKQRESRR